MTLFGYLPIKIRFLLTMLSKKLPRRPLFSIKSLLLAVANLFNSQSYRQSKFAKNRALLNQAIVHYNRGWAKSRSGCNRAAITEYNRAITIDARLVDAYINRANAKAKLEQYHLAITDYDRAIALDPQDAYAYYNRGSAKYRFGQQSAAMDDFERATALDPRLTLKIVQGLLDLA